MVKPSLLVGRTIFQRKAYFSIEMVVCGLPRVLIIQNSQKTSVTNHRKAIFGAAKDMCKGDVFFLATNEELLKQIAAVHHLKLCKKRLWSSGCHLIC